MKDLWIPSLLLAALLGACMVNCAAMTAETDRWSQQLQAADTLSTAEDWPAVLHTLQASYADWQNRQTYLHIVAEHEAVDGAEAMYRRALAFAKTQEVTEFRAELADLRHQLTLLAEMERFSIKNVL